MENAMSTPPAMPKAPASPAPNLSAFSALLNPADIARALDILAFFFTADMKIHPDDLVEIKAISARIRNSINNA
jgi:hypothetical protein